MSHKTHPLLVTEDGLYQAVQSGHQYLRENGFWSLVDDEDPDPAQFDAATFKFNTLVFKVASTPK